MARHPGGGIPPPGCAEFLGWTMSNALEDNHPSKAAGPFLSNISRREAILIAVLAIFLAFSVLLRIAICMSGRDAILPSLLPGMEWEQQHTLTEGDNRTAKGYWQWPKIQLFRNSSAEISIGINVLLDMTAAAIAMVLGVVLFHLSSLRPVSRGRIAQHAVAAAFLALILAYTYHWCRIDFSDLWHFRRNAWVYLLGRKFSPEELQHIRQEAERAPAYFSEGEANYIISERYKDVPPHMTPSPFQKQKEIREEKERILARLTEKERKAIIEKEFLRLLDKKRGGYWPPELSPPRLWVYLTALLETVAIAIWSSLLAVLCAIPISLFAAWNTMELIIPGEGRLYRALRWFAIFVVRRFLDACRGFNELVMALIFVSVIGLGPFAGILALWIHTTGILGKIFSEAIEDIDSGQVEALVGTGAGAAQAISFAVLPQIMPSVISNSLLRFESNVRSAAILGWVGAGGIGFLLQDKMVGYAHREVCTMMLMIIITVSIIDYACARLRRHFS